MKYQKETPIFISGVQKKYQKIVRQKMILRHPRRQRPHPRSVMKPHSRNQCRHTLYR